MRKLSVSSPFSTTQALKGAKVMPTVRSTGPNTSLISRFGPHRAPAITRPWPSMNFVAECMTTSAPNSTGRCNDGVE